MSGATRTRRTASGREIRSNYSVVKTVSGWACEGCGREFGELFCPRPAHRSRQYEGLSLARAMNHADVCDGPGAAPTYHVPESVEDNRKRIYRCRASINVHKAPGGNVSLYVKQCRNRVKGPGDRCWLHQRFTSALSPLAGGDEL